MKTYILILFLCLFLFFCKEKEITNEVYEGKYRYNKSIIDTFSIKISDIPNDSIFNMDKLFDLNDYYNNTYYKKIFFDNKLLKNNDSIGYYGYFNSQKTKMHFFIDGDESEFSSSCLVYLALLKKNDEYLFIKIQNFIIMESSFFTFKIKNNYILLNLIDGISDVIDEDNPELEDIKYAIVEIKDNDFHILDFEESEKILFEKFKEEEVDKYRKK